MTNLLKENETEIVNENVLHIPATEPKIIPGTPERTIKLPTFLKQQDNIFIRIDSEVKYLRVWCGTYYTQISYCDYVDSISDSVSAYLKNPESYVEITEEQFNEAFTTALSAICTAHGMNNVVKVEAV